MRTCFSLMLLALLTTPVRSQSDVRVWNVKAVLPTGTTLDIKAFDPDGVPVDVKALENGDTHLMDIKALASGGQLPIKVINSTDAFLPVKAIASDGHLLDVKAVDADGNRFDVKGVSVAGSIIDIKAIGANRELYGVKAISPTGQMRDVKGVRMMEGEVEEVVNNVAIRAHVKAVPHPDMTDGDLIWNVKCVLPDGHILGVKAVDKAGVAHDVKAFVDNGDATILEVKALIDGKKVPVKVIKGKDGRSQVVAIGADGTLYGLKAIGADGKQLDVVATTKSGNVFGMKALAADGTLLGIKAISPHGLFYDVKGLSFSAEGKEVLVNGVAVQAHVKAMPQVE